MCAFESEAYQIWTQLFYGYGLYSDTLRAKVLQDCGPTFANYYTSNCYNDINAVSNQVGVINM